MNTGASLYNADFIHSSTIKYYFVLLLVSFNFIGATKMNEIFDRKLFLQDHEIQLLEISIELRKLTNKIEEQLSKIDVQKKECDKIISDFEKDMEKEMLDDQKKNIKVCK